MAIDSTTMERIVPDHVSAEEATGAETLKIHLDRYEFAAQHIKPGLVLDCACGVGYGSYFMMEQVPEKFDKLVGVDLSTEAIEYASERYKHPKIEFINCNATKFKYPQKFDTIVSLETIEHIPNPRLVTAHLKSLLKPGGTFIASVPTTPSVDANPHHVTDFTEKTFRQMFINMGMTEIDCFKQIQPYSFFKIATRQETRAKKLRRNLPLYYLQNPMMAVKRVQTTLVNGFNNHYITIVWQNG